MQSTDAQLEAPTCVSINLQLISVWPMVSMLAAWYLFRRENIDFSFWPSIKRKWRWSVRTLPTLIDQGSTACKTSPPNSVWNHQTSYGTFRAVYVDRVVVSLLFSSSLVERSKLGRRGSKIVFIWKEGNFKNTFWCFVCLLVGFWGFEPPRTKYL